MIFQQVLSQERKDPDKIYSRHEPQAYCIAKGKDHKKYEYGTKASITMTSTTGIIVGALLQRQLLRWSHLDEAWNSERRLTATQNSYCRPGYRDEIMRTLKFLSPKTIETRHHYQKEK